MPTRTLSGEPQVRKGACLILFAYDVAPYIDLERCERSFRAATHRLTIAKRRRALEYFEFRPAPVGITLGVEPVRVGQHQTEPSVDLVIYDFGAFTVTFTLTFEGSLSKVVELSGEIHDAIYESEFLPVASRRTLEHVLGVLKDAIPDVRVADIVEDYFIFRIEEFDAPLDAESLSTTYADQIAKILRAESGELSHQEIEDALELRIAFSPADLAILDWNAALLYGSATDDLRTVIEFANVQLLELRFLDRQLDEILEKSYTLVSQRGWRWSSALQSYRREARQIARLQVDGAIVFERVSNALKVFGEEYLSRVYTLIAERLHLAAWDQSAIRKLGTIDSIYQKLSDEAAARRLEILEWIIVILIAVSILLSLAP